jgi:hypothetical protein
LMKLDWKMTVDSELHDVELPVQFQGEAWKRNSWESASAFHTNHAFFSLLAFVEIMIVRIITSSIRCRRSSFVELYGLQKYEFRIIRKGGRFRAFREFVNSSQHCTNIVNDVSNKWLTLLCNRSFQDLSHPLGIGTIMLEGHPRYVEFETTRWWSQRRKSLTGLLTIN